MNTTKTIITTIAIVAALATVGATLAQSIVSHQAFADQPQYCYNNGQGDRDCLSSQEQCERAAEHDNQCKNNRA
jgi:uncharacterized membrane protein